MSSETLASIRRDYALKELNRSSVDPNPFVQFSCWIDEAVASEIRDPTAMTLCTSSAAGRPTSRVVLLKGIDETGLVFFTNYASRKATEIEANPQVSLHFFWRDLERQIAVIGRASRVERAESEAYFSTRPRGSQIGAWASHQSQTLASRGELEARFAEIEARYNATDVPCPPFWGGYRVVPESFEFWQGRLSRLHDRILYARSPQGWSISRLSP